MRHLRNEETRMLGRELDILMGERQTLLEVAGAAAALIASLDGRQLPAAAVRSADLLAAMINVLPDETLVDALAAVRAEIEEDKAAAKGERVVSH